MQLMYLVLTQLELYIWNLYISFVVKWHRIIAIARVNLCKLS